ncbi:427_t:CDS:2, partial [Funneliformis geosporum]
CKTVEVTSQLTDHLIVIVKIENFLDIKHNRRNIPLKRVFDFNKMTEETWKLFVISADWHIQICRFYAILQHFDIPFVALPRDPPI